MVVVVVVIVCIGDGALLRQGEADPLPWPGVRRTCDQNPLSRRHQGEAPPRLHPLRHLHLEYLAHGLGGRGRPPCAFLGGAGEVGGGGGGRGRELYGVAGGGVGRALNLDYVGADA